MIGTMIYWLCLLNQTRSSESLSQAGKHRDAPACGQADSESSSHWLLHFKFASFSLSAVHAFRILANHGGEPASIAAQAALLRIRGTGPSGLLQSSESS